MIQLLTIGFTRKSAEWFFHLLTESGVQKIVDTRIHATSQLAGFAKKQDLAFFAPKIGNIAYEHRIDCAPTKFLLAKYRNAEISWEEYAIEYLNLLDMRKIVQKIPPETLHQHCLLCSEHSPEQCHRRLLAEYFQAVRKDVQIIHLI
ncbi:MAG: hypothetical protein RL329_270 [Bacteroidota bacterium]|jgi:uncharacterized protein (DUF488 family)